MLLRLHGYIPSGLVGHQSGHQLVTFHFRVTFSSVPSSSSNSNPNPNSPRAAPSTWSSLNNANPTPCVELRSLLVPRGREVGRSSVEERAIEARMSMEGGKDGLVGEGDISNGLDVRGERKEESQCG
jgi:hypothetical protein